MKRRILFYVMTLPFAVMAMSCGKTVADEEKDDGALSVWEKTDAELCGLSGKVKSVTEYLEVEGERHILKSMSFDEEGRVLVYNPVGIDVFGSETGITTFAYDQETKAYSYSYDDLGRIASVEEREIGGEPVIYTVKYDGSSLMVPFNKMGFSYFLLKGVSSIEATNGFRLENKDGKVFSEYESRMGLFKMQVSSELVFANSLPAKENIKYSVQGETAYMETRTYSWYGNSSPSSISTEKAEPEAPVIKDSLVLSSLFPLMPVAERQYADGVLQTELNYVYDTDGRLLRTYYTEGYEDPFGFGTVYSMEYKKSDAAGNWTEAIRKDESGESVILREVLYYL